MPYFPKSQIKTNLYTNGSEYILSTTREPYKGNFYEISNGNKYTGKSPSNGPNILLISNIPNLSSLINSKIKSSSTPLISSPLIPSFIPNFTPRSLPSPNPTLPTEEDYKFGEFQRYFSKKNNELKYLEIDKETYTLLQNKDSKIAWDLYSPLTVTWELAGDEEQVYKVNKNMVELAEKRNKWYGFTQWFRDKFSKYYLAS